MPDYKMPPEEFRKRMEGFDQQAIDVIEERLRTNFSREHYDVLSVDETATLEAMLDRLIPQENGRDKIDLVGFMDWAIPKPLGIGSREEGMPDEETLYHEGLRGVDETASAMHGKRFVQLSEKQKDDVLRAIQEGTTEGDVWKRIPSDAFFRQLMSKAIMPYCAHPRTWMRIGFYGPAYPEGYVWVSPHEVKMRHEDKPGHTYF